MSKVEMLCWAILAMQVLITCIGGFVADKVHQTWCIALRAEHERHDVVYGGGVHDLKELEQAIDKTFDPRFHPNYAGPVTGSAGGGSGEPDTPRRG